MGEKGLETIHTVIENNYAKYIDYVIVAQDKNVINDYYDDIICCCKDNHINVCDKSQMPSLDSDYYIAVSWRWIIDKSSNLIVLHDSLLPKYRGFAPLVNMLIHKEQQIGVTALYADDNYDRGDIIVQKSISIKYPIRIADAISLITKLYGQIVIELIRMLINGSKIPRYQQIEEEATYSLWRDDSDYRINWNDSAENILQFIFSTGYPYKGALSLLNGKEVRIIDCDIFPDVSIENRDCGKVIFCKDGNPVVVCKVGLLQLKDIRDNNGNSILPLSRFRSRFE